MKVPGMQRRYRELGPPWVWHSKVLWAFTVSRRDSSKPRPAARYSPVGVAALLILVGTIGFASAEGSRQLIAIDAGQFHNFGLAVSVDGDTAAVGAPNFILSGFAQTGAVYVFERNHGAMESWGEAAFLLASDGAGGDDFGFAVSVSGDVIVVGAPVDDAGLGEKQGSVYVFERDAGGPGLWGQVKTLTASDGSAGDQFGYSVSVSGEVIVVGAAAHQVGGVLERGSAYIFERDAGGAGNWGQVKWLSAVGGATAQHFGASVSVSGDVVVVGAPDYEVGGNADQGVAFVYERNNGGDGNWGEVAPLIANDGAAGDDFGYSIAVSGDRIVVGAPVDDVVYANQGSAYVFERSSVGPHSWGQVEKLVPSDGAFNDQFGFSVAASGGVVAVGAPGFDSGLNSEVGAAYLFERNEGGVNNWGQFQKMTAAVAGQYDFLGFSVSVSGETTLVGAAADTVDFQEQGTAYVFWRERLELLSPTWANGMFHATVIGTPGLGFSLQTSTDLTTWTTLTNTSLSPDAMLISVPALAPWGVYRAIAPPVP